MKKMGRTQKTESSKKGAAEIQDAIRSILYRDWDPIGVCRSGLEDEYDPYTAGVYRILSTNR